ncbi:laccase domain-containing protein [Bacteroides caecimuris]|uniref:laccase domain-containing protein n=2 Tax=Bacteroidales TaxID=171549 RepID=UPI002664E4F8|nr:laccase domain-containing protein [Bacteroides caecimuris]
MSRALLTTYDLLNLPGIHAFSTLRGCSDPSAPYDGFNTCHYSGDDPVHVSVCRGRLSEFIGIPPEKVFIPRQTHFARVVTVAHYSLNTFSEIPFYMLSLYISYLQMFSFGLNTHEISRF